MAVPTVTNDEDVNFEFEVEHFTDVQTISDVSRVLMEIDQGLVLLGVLLFYKPPMKGQLILSDYPDVLIYHVAFAGVPISFGVIFGVSESLIGCIRDVEHPVLHKVDHQQGEY